MRPFPIITMISVVVWLCGCQAAAPTASEASHVTAVSDAKKIALDWLTLVDTERYGDAYDRYTEAAKRRVKTKEQSISFYRAVRQPHGTPLDRRIASERYVTTLPMLPVGEYVVIDFETDFPAKKNVKEEVLTERIGGKWEVSGYACGK